MAVSEFLRRRDLMSKTHFICRIYALLDELSQAAADSEFELEELIATYINERAELERLDTLHEKSEVSDRVYDRLKGEYDEKLGSFDERIQKGVHELQGYLAQILQDSPP